MALGIFDNLLSLIPFAGGISGFHPTLLVDSQATIDHR
jgi:hypothetical protein